MAEGNKEGDNWWGQAGWGGWLKNVQEKSGHAWEQMRRDLGEFGSTIQRDTAQAAATTANIIKDQLKVAEEEEESVTTTARMKVGFSKLLTGLSQSLAPGEGGGGGREEEVVPPTHKDPHIFDKVRARLHAMQTDPTTYCSDPDGHPDFREWLEEFNVDTHKGEISELLVVNTEVRALYTKLVPAAVSHVEFWGRYFYRVQQLKEDEARRRALKERADMTSSQKFEEEDLGWGDEDESYDTLPDASRDQSGTEKFVVLPENAEKERIDRIETPHQSKPESQLSESHLPVSDRVTGAQASEDKDTSQTLTPATISRNNDQSEQLKSTDQGHVLKEESERPQQSIGKSDSVPSQPETQIPPQPSATKHQVSSRSDVDSVPGVSTADDDVAKVSGHVGSQDASGKDKEVDQKENLRLKGLTVEMVSQQDGQKVEEAKAEQVSPVASEASNRESSLSDDWEKDFDDIEVTPEDLKNASVKLASGTGDDDLDDDWESWE